MPMKKTDAKALARERLRGVWAAAPTPFRPDDLALDEAGLRANVAHWIGELKVDGLFIGGKQGEFFSMSVPERKRLFEVSADAARAVGGQVILSCSDQNLDTVLDLARHAQAIGAEWIVVHSPMLHFGRDVDDTVFEYYRHVAGQVDLGIAMWSHPDAGYLMSPELCARIADAVPNVVAIKYSVERALYARLTRMTEGRLIVSTASEDEWLDNIVELGWRLYLCSIPPLLYQRAGDTRIRDYTDAALRGDVELARRISASLDPVRRALKGSRPPGTPHAQQKHWLDRLGRVGGPVRRPLLPLTDAQRAAIDAAFDACGLAAPAGAGAAAASVPDATAGRATPPAAAARR
jgi:4-hydroxy-tetrahydrodipicolinate synthase